MKWGWNPFTGDFDMYNVGNVVADSNGVITQQYAENQTTKTATFTIAITDLFTVYFCNHSAAITANLPPAATCQGRKFRIIDITNNASVNTITVDPDSAELINGASTYVISIDREALEIESDGTGWVII